MTGSYKDTLRFFFTVTDVEGDSVFVSFYYRSADTLGSEWRQVVTFSGDSGLLVPGSGYEVLWATGVDLNRASIVGDTLVGRGGYSGYLVQELIMGLEVILLVLLLEI